MDTNRPNRRTNNYLITHFLIPHCLGIRLLRKFGAPALLEFSEFLRGDWARMPRLPVQLMQGIYDGMASLDLREMLTKPTVRRDAYRQSGF